jgi:hypothetical protein
MLEISTKSRITELVLPNGAIEIERYQGTEYGVVLGMFPNKEFSKYVSWAYNVKCKAKDNSIVEYYWGHYYDSILIAAEDYTERKFNIH